MSDLSRLVDFVLRHPRLFVLTGAGCSTESGIPDYRDAHGEWKRAPPVNYQDFVHDDATRRRYWARSLVGWRLMARAAPGAAHRALTALERMDRVTCLVTQNVDGLHTNAGSRAVIDLHGRIDAVRCLDCGATYARADVQQALVARNPGWAALDAASAPDGDADLAADFSTFDVPACSACGGMLKPDVVFFGENVPRDRVATALAALEASDAMLVAGSSLMVYSGYRFAQAAAGRGVPIAAVNLGRTRADDLFAQKVAAPAGAMLTALVAALAGRTVASAR